MHSESQSPNSTIRTVLLITLITLVGAVVPARAQNAVPPTARQAAAIPAFAHRLKPPAAPQSPRRFAASTRAQIRPGSPLDTGIAYDNGPVNGEVNAWSINFGFTVSDTIQVNGPVTGIQFWAWLEPGDTLSNVEVQIGDNYFSNDLFDGVVTLTESNCFTNNFGFNVCLVSGTFTGPTLSGNDWVTLAKANTAQGNPVYWDENSGVGCQSPGCPSQAQEDTLGTIPSEAFTLTGGMSTTTVDCGHDPQLQVIHDFTGGADGSYPTGVVPDKAGNFYGTTSTGGNGGAGTAFKLVEGGSNWLLNTLYSFAGGAAGGNPSAPIIGPNGTLYGTSSGGVQNCNNGQYCGQVINLTPQPTACATVMCSWRENILYQFAGGVDAPGTISAVDQDGNFYGTELYGGAYGQGAIFELSPSGGSWAKKVLYSFTGGNDGENPQSLLLRNSDGNLYGYAQAGPNDTGLIFQLARSGNTWAENTIYQVSGYGDGLFPLLVQNSSGNLYGAQTYYWTNQWGVYVDGVVFHLSLINGTWTASQVYTIAPTTWDSQVYITGLAADPAGVIYSAANAYCFGCFPGYQFLFNEISDHGEPLVYLGENFYVGGMTTDAQGNLYGVSDCGAYRQGTVWEVSRH